MIFQVMFKCPDAVDEALRDREEEERAKLQGAASKFVCYGELVTIEFDTDAGTAKVLEAR